MSEKDKRPEKKRSDVTGDYPAIPRVIEQMRRNGSSRLIPRLNRSIELDKTQDLGPDAEVPNDEKIEE